MKNNINTFFVLVTLLASSAFADTRIDKLNLLFSEYNKRFTSGVYVSNQQQINSFNSQQDAFAADIKNTRGMQSALQITNDYDASLSVQLYLLFDDSLNLLGFYYEKSTYDSEEERSFLRLKLLADLEKGVGFVPVNGAHALTVKGFYFKPSTGGTLQFAYLTDLKNKSYAAVNIFVIKKDQAWGLYNEAYQPVSWADVITWTSFFPPNGGVKQVLLK